MVRIISMTCALLLGSLPLCASADIEEVEFFVDFGMNGTQLEFDPNSSEVSDESDFDVGYHLGLGARKQVAPNHWFGARAELDDIHGDTMLAFRAIDYQYQFDDHWRAGAFLGAARLDTGAATTGYYLGAGVLYRDLFPNFDVGLDARYGDSLSRDKLLEGDPQTGGPDFYYDIYGFSLYLSWRL